MNVCRATNDASVPPRTDGRQGCSNCDTALRKRRDQNSPRLTPALLDAARSGQVGSRGFIRIRALLTAMAVGSCDDGIGHEQPSDRTRNIVERSPVVDLPVLAKPARVGDLVLGVTTTGVVRSVSEGTLRAEVGGEVQTVGIAPGARVSRGQALIALDPRPFDFAVEEQEIAVADATLRFQDFLLGDSITKRARPDSALRKVALVRSGLAAAQVRLARARFEHEKATIVAPFGGVVDDIAVAVGERVVPGQELTRVVDIEGLRIEATVLEHDLPLIRVGGEAMVTSSAAPGRPMHGRISAVLPRVDTATRSGRVWVAVRADGLLRPGMSVDIRLESARLTSRLLVPTAAVIERDGRPLVFVVTAGRAQWVYIRPGRSNGIETEVQPDSTSGRTPLRAGAMVIVDGHLTLTHDAPVRVVPARSAQQSTP